MEFRTSVDALNGKDNIITVELQKCRDWLSFSYSGDGWHYHSALIKQYIDMPNLLYSESILKQYYDRFHPECLQDIFFEHTQNNLPPIHKAGPPLPWLASPPRFGRTYQHYGPNTDAFIQSEFSRTIDIYNKLSNNSGNLSDICEDGYIKGYVLKNDSDYRFIVTNGHHRLAAISNLNQTTLRVKLDPKLSKVIDIHQAHAWMNVRNGIYSKKLAIALFEKYFEINGRERALSLGLYSKIY